MDYYIGRRNIGKLTFEKEVKSMLKLNNRAISTPFVSLDVGDTFIGGDNNYYIKIQSVAKTKNFDVVGTYNAVCLTDGKLAYVDGSQPITIVEIEGVVACQR